MNKKVLIGNIIGLIIIVGLAGLIYFAVTQDNKKKTENEEQKQNDIQEAIDIIKDAKNEQEFKYSEPIKQEDGTYKVDITNKNTNESRAYYIIDVEKDEYQLVAIGYRKGNCTKEDCPPKKES